MTGWGVGRVTNGVISVKEEAHHRRHSITALRRTSSKMAELPVTVIQDLRRTLSQAFSETSPTISWVLHIYRRRFGSYNLCCRRNKLPKKAVSENDNERTIAEVSMEMRE